MNTEIVYTPAIEPRPTRLLHVKTVCERTSLSRSTILNLRAVGQFPEPVEIAYQRIAWVESEVESWIAARIAERNAKIEGQGDGEA